MGNLQSIWYEEGHPLSRVLQPLAWLYCAVVRVRRWGYRRGWLSTERLPVPVIVVGNLSVGGTGKTPLVLWLALRLRERGHRPGILLRGYGGRSDHWPRLVPPRGDPDQFGDEAVLLAGRSGRPVAVGPDRLAAGRLLLAHQGCDLLICDDGLQHYRLHRDLEILVLDGQRRLGNGRCLPAGPLREPPDRAADIALRLCTEGLCPGAERMDLAPGPLVALNDPDQRQPLSAWAGRRVTAVAGIGHPHRFFGLLERFGLRVEKRPYPDHHRFRRRDLASWPPGPVIMTEKDAVKCVALARERTDLWYLPIEAVPSPTFEKRFFDAALPNLLGGA